MLHVFISLGPFLKDYELNLKRILGREWSWLHIFKIVRLPPQNSFPNQFVFQETKAVIFTWSSRSSYFLSLFPFSTPVFFLKPKFLLF